MEHYGVELSFNLEKRGEEKYTMRGSFYRNKNDGSFRGAVFDYYHGVLRPIYGKMGKVTFNLYFCSDDLGFYGVGGFSARVESEFVNLIYYPDGFDGRAYFMLTGLELVKLANRPNSQTYKRFNDKVFSSQLIPSKDECIPDNRKIVYDFWLENDYKPVSFTGQEEKYEFDEEEFLAVNNEDEDEPEPETESTPNPDQNIGVRGDPGYEYL